MKRTLASLVVPAFFAALGGGASAQHVQSGPVNQPAANQAQPPVQTQGLSAPSTMTVLPVVRTWEEVRQAQELLKKTGKPVVTNPAPKSPFLTPGVMYENPEEIAGKKAKIAQFEMKARAAIAAGQQPPAFWKPYNPATDTMDGTRPAIDKLVRPAQGPPAIPAEPGLKFEGNDGQADDTAVIPPPSGGGDPSGAFDDRAPSGFQNWQGIEDTSRPSDSVCAVGAAHVGVIVNTELAFYRKDGTMVVGPTDLAAFFSGNPAGDDLYDPKIVYDVHENRFIMLALNGRRLAQVYWAIAISQTSNPEGNWWVYYLRSDIDGSTDTALWADYPGLAFDGGDATAGANGGALYVTSNMYTAADSFQYAKLRVLKKSQLYNGGGVSWWDFWGFKNDDGTNIFSWKPATVYSTGSAPNMFLVNTKSGGWDRITRYQITNPLASGPTIAGPTAIAVNTYDVPPSAKQSGGGTTLLLDSNDCRTQDAAYWDGWVFTTVADTLDWGTPANVEAVLHHFKLNILAPSVTWDERFGSDNLYYTYANVASDQNYNGTYVFTRTGLSEFAGMRYTGRLAADTAMQSSALLKAGEATYNPTGSTVERWGDYSGIGTDCASDGFGTFFVSQYARTGTQWGTWVGSASFGQPNETHLEDLETTGFIGDAERHYTFRIRSGDWAGIGMYQQIGGNYNLAASLTCPFGTPYQFATLGTDVRDFIVANGTQYGTEYHHARFTYVSGPTGVRMEVRNQSTDVAVGSLGAGSTASTAHVLDLWECALTSGKVYAAQVLGVDGNTDYDLFKFNGSRFNGRRFDNDGVSESNNGTGAASEETIAFTASETSTHGFAVTNENFGSGNYTFKVWLKPLVAAISNEGACTSERYLGPTPTLTEGSTPVAWSLITAPAGTTINSSTGVVRWNTPVKGNFTFTIRATNPAGFDNESWNVTFCPADYNCDGFVTGDDYDLFVDAFEAGSLKADYDGNGFITGDDFDAFSLDFANGC